MDKINNIIEVVHWRYITTKINCILKIEKLEDNIGLIIYDLEIDKIRDIIIDNSMLLQILNVSNKILEPASKKEVEKFNRKLKERCENL